jgi:integrase
MSVRKRRDATKRPWQVDYRDGRGRRRSKQFASRKNAEAFAATTSVEVREGLHVADRASVTLIDAAARWIESAEAADLEISTIIQYQQHLRLHVMPVMGNVLLSKLSLPMIREFEDRLRDQGRSPAMVRKVICSLGGVLADAQERGLVARNVVRDRGYRRSGDRQGRRTSRLRVGLDVPTPADIRVIVSIASGRYRPLIITAVFTGLRASELRGLRWCDVELEARALHVRQRADRWGDMGPPKSEASQRSVPLPPIVVNTLREWKLACPKGELDLVFPTSKGKPQSHSNIVQRGLWPTLIAAGLCDVIDGVQVPRYKGMHSFRHWYASWCLNRREDGGLGLPYKSVQARLGHSTLAMTIDVYGHLFPDPDEADLLAEGEKALLA